jgi:hypothetical protein
MANQVAARLRGDDYQHLFAWREALDLLRPRKGVTEIRVEDEDAFSVDDVTVRYALPSEPRRYYQIKFHVDQRTQYSTEVVMDVRATAGTSLLQKLWRSFQKLIASGPGLVELSLYSNWNWDSNDPFAGVIDGDDGSIKDEFIAAPPASDLGKLRRRWREHLNATDAELVPFLGALRLRAGYACWTELRDGVAERMENLGLQWDEAALLTAVGIVREWIKRGPSAIDADAMRAVISSHRLLLPPDAERATLVVMNTIATPRVEVAPDFALDWCERFEGRAGRRGQQLLVPSEWNDRLLPELRRVERRIKEDTGDRLIRARGAARLTPWIAFGATFSEVAGYTIEVEQRIAGGVIERWRSDAPASADWKLLETMRPSTVKESNGPTSSLAVAIGLTDDIQDDVARYMAEQRSLSRLLVLLPEDGPSARSLRTGGDATAFAEQAKQLIRRAVRVVGVERLELFYCGPSAGACFLGHRLNAVAKQITLMEFQQPGYSPTFVLD